MNITKRGKAAVDGTPIQFRLRPDEHRKLKMLAAATGKTMRELIVVAVVRYLEAEGKAA